MSLTVTIIAKLSGVDSRHGAARVRHGRARSMARPTRAPEDFTYGAGARCYALATIAEYRPALFWGGLARDRRNPGAHAGEGAAWLAASDRT